MLKGELRRIEASSTSGKKRRVNTASRKNALRGPAESDLETQETGISFGNKLKPKPNQDRR